MVKEIVQKDHKVLRQIAEKIPVGDITSPKIQKIIKEMEKALEGEHDGVALAAPQIAYPLRIFVVSWRAFDDEFVSGRQARLEEGEEQELEEKKKERKNLIFINPVIKRRSRDKDWMPEGCLSVRPVYGSVHRSKKATVTAYDEKGKKFTMNGSGLLAQIFQHETDHLEGILFIDKARDMREEELLRE
jgi:peptide deformylase